MHVERLPVTAEEHAKHWTSHPRTGERVEESFVVSDGQRVYWCGYTEPMNADGSGVPCEHCGKVWLHGDCYTTTSQMIRCIGLPQVGTTPDAR